MTTAPPDATADHNGWIALPASRRRPSGPMRIASVSHFAPWITIARVPASKSGFAPFRSAHARPPTLSLVGVRPGSPVRARRCDGRRISQGMIVAESLAAVRWRPGRFHRLTTQGPAACATGRNTGRIVPTPMRVGRVAPGQPGRTPLAPSGRVAC